MTAPYNVRSILLLLAAALATLSACNDRTEHVYQGYVEGEFVRVSVPEAGILETLDVARGQMVAPGDPLFGLESARERANRDEATARVAQAQANLENLLKGSREPEIAMLAAELRGARSELALARINLRRQQDLAAREYASERAVDEARTNVDRWSARVAEIEAQIETAELGGRSDEIEAARAALSASQAALAQTEWRIERRRPVAPAHALVHDTLYRPGEFVAAGAPVVSLLPPEQVLIRFFVPEPELGLLRYGAAVRVSCDGCPDDIRAHVTYVSDEAEYTPPVIYSRDSRSKLVFLIEAHPDDVDAALRLHPGQPVDVVLVETANGETNGTGDEEVATR